MEDKTILYSVRYPSAQEEGERIKVRGDRQAAEAKLTEFLRRMRERVRSLGSVLGRLAAQTSHIPNSSASRRVISLE